jgi:hypothetical protein
MIISSFLKKYSKNNICPKIIEFVFCKQIQEEQQNVNHEKKHQKLKKS